MQLDIRQLGKCYPHGRGLLPTSFTVTQGELIAIVGHNGAGKSTLLKMLANWIPPDNGQVLIDGIDLRHRTAVVRRIGFVPEMPHLYDLFSVDYNLKLFARLLGTRIERVDIILDELKLLPFRKTKVHVLSKGLKQRVNIGRALLADPALLLLDEPTSGLDFDMTKEMYQLLSAMHSNGKTILFTTHRPEEIKNLATRIIVLHQGNIVFDGSSPMYFASAIHEHLYA